MAVFRAKKFEIVETLEQFVPQLLSHLRLYDVISFEERERMEKAAGASKDVLLSLVDKLEVKDGGLVALTDFLRKNNMNTFATNLEVCAKQLPTVYSGSGGGLLDQFLRKLANYYKRSSNVWIPGNSEVEVSDVYVPLSLLEEEKTENKTVSTDTMLLQLRANDRVSVALIKGHPGTGKTTLMLQLALDWADKYLKGQGKENIFSVVLHVPLKSELAKCDDILVMSVGYLLKAVKMRNAPLPDMLQLIEDMESRVVVLLDGLDECNIQNTELGTTFAPKFDTEAKNVVAPPPFPHKLVVATRPYAGRKINPRVKVAKYSIAPLTGEERLTFATAYCSNSEYKKALPIVRSYLTLPESRALPVQTPLVLLFVCFLAECDEEIPSSRTRLYERCLFHMMRRTVMIKAEQLGQDIRPDNPGFDWTTTTVAQKTSNLAVVCCHKDLPTVEPVVLEQLDVPNDSFTCGYLLYKFDTAENTFLAQFPHRSLQEYFAALNCYQLIVDGKAAEAKAHVNELIYRYDEISKFLLGTASSKGTFGNVARSVFPPTASAFEAHVLTQVVAQNESNPDIRPEEFRFLKEQDESLLTRIYPSFDMAAFVSKASEFVLDPAILPSHFSVANLVDTMSFVYEGFGDLLTDSPLLSNTSDGSGFVMHDFSVLTRFPFVQTTLNAMMTVLGYTSDNGLVVPDALAPDFGNQFALLVNDSPTFLCRAGSGNYEAYFAAPGNPRSTKIAVSIGPVATIWREKFDTINNFFWMIDHSEILRLSDQLNLLPQDVRHLSVLTAPFSFSPNQVFQKTAKIKYKNQLPKHLKEVQLFFNKSQLLDGSLRGVELQSSVSCHTVSNKQVVIEVGSECERDRLVLTIIRLVLELHCGTTFLEDDLD